MIDCKVKDANVPHTLIITFDWLKKSGRGLCLPRTGRSPLVLVLNIYLIYQTFILAAYYHVVELANGNPSEKPFTVLSECR